MNARFLIAIFVGLAAILGMAGIFGIYLILHERDPLPPREGAADGRRDVIAAFRDRPGEPPPKDFQQFFSEFGTCLKAGGGGGERFWDIRRFAREVNRDGAFTRAGLSPNNSSLLEGMRHGVTQMMANLAQSLGYDETDVRAVKWLVPDREAVVITRHLSRNGKDVVRFKMRWWLIKDGGGWRVYDLEDVSVGGRISTLGGSVIAELLASGKAAFSEFEIRRLQAKVALFQEAETALLSGEFAKAERLLADPQLASLPRSLNPVVKLWQSIAAMRLNKIPQSLKFLDEAERGLPDCPVVLLLRATCYGKTEEWDKVLVAGGKYVELIGPDEEVCIEMGNALVELDRHAEAANEYRRALDDVPDSEVALQGLIVCLKPGERGEIAKRFANFNEPAKILADLVRYAGNNEDAIEELIDVVRKKAPDDPEGLFQAGAQRLRKNDVPAAVKLYLDAIAHAGKQRDIFLRRFAGSMSRKGQSAKAYAALADADAENGFKALAESLDDELDDGDEGPNLKALAELLAAHRKRKPDDIWLSYYQGVLHRARLEHDDAEKVLAAGMKRNLAADEREQFRWLRVDNLTQAGRAVQAYAMVAPRRTTFNQVAGQMNDKPQTPMLAILVWMHGWVDPADPALRLWRGNLNYRTGQYEAALRELKAYLKPASKNPKPYEWQVKDQVVRSLLRLKRLAEARKTLRPDNDKEYYNRVLDAAITAASGDVAKTEKELDELIRAERATPASFHADADLGPILRTAPFKKLLVKFPPPKVDGPRG